jgi:hypothetical protein
MGHGITPPVELASAKQLQGRFVRVTSAKALAAQHERGVLMNLDWRARPDLKDHRDAKFFAAAAAHNRWPELGRFICSAVVRGKRCNRINIIETGHKHCIKHAGPTAARLYRENCRRLFESSRYPSHHWFADEERRMRTRIRDRQRRKRGGWMLPGLTLRFSAEIEARFRQDAALVLLQGRPWDAVPDFHRDQLRWAWRKFCLDRQKPAAWGSQGQGDHARSRHARPGRNRRSPARHRPRVRARSSAPWRHRLL